MLVIIIDKIIFSEENQALLGDHINQMREQGEYQNVIDIAEDFYDGICKLHKDFLKELKFQYSITMNDLTEFIVMTDQ